MSECTDFDALFKNAMGHAPYPYQRRVAAGDTLPEVIDVPPGLGKTAAVVLAWIWLRLFHPDPEVRSSTPLRLVIALPMRTLTRQTHTVVSRIVERLGIDVGIGLLTGESPDRRSRQWRLEPHRPQILISISDMAVSAGLMRAYGSSRSCFPIDAGYVWNDAHIVVDETQLIPHATTTARQISAFQKAHGGIRFGLTCMSATISKELLATVDNPFPPLERVVSLEASDETPELVRRLDAKRMISQLSIDASKAKEFAAEVLRLHQADTLTIVVVNTVDRAVDIYRKAQAINMSHDNGPRLVLLHSRFRPCDRDSKLDGVAKDPSHVIVIATQIVEAGIDLDAATLITESAPWSSLVQRSGRCNRTGNQASAHLYWMSPPRAAPYEDTDVDATTEALASLEGQLVSNRELLNQQVRQPIPEVPVIRESDFTGLFDTTPDLTGNDFDISPFIRDADDMDAMVAWVEIAPSGPDNDTTIPEPAARCRVPLSAVRKAATRPNNRVTFWCFSPSTRKWEQVSNSRTARPGEVLLTDVKSGMYSTETGFDVSMKSKTDVADLPDLSAAEYRLIDTDQSADSADSDQGSLGQDGWVTLDDHLNEARAQSEALVADLALTSELREDISLAAYLHDVGKAHPTWQDALQATGEPPSSSTAWAKSPNKGRLAYSGGVTSFRHELASVAILDAELSTLLDDAHDRDLVRYLIAAHHGKIRMKVRDLEGTESRTTFGLRSETVTIRPVLGEPVTDVAMTTSQFRTVNPGGPGWVDMTTDLIARYGMCQLAYFEMLVRIADWRASNPDLAIIRNGRS